jgi:Mrp family chromosome partitioning ATPase/cell division septation protein DedD
MMGTVTVFRTPDEAALELELPLLGVVPVPPNRKGPICPVAPDDETAAKAYGRALERVMRPTEPGGSIGVVGDVDPAQRAFVSGALAAVLASQRGAVLVDADLRGAHLSFDAGSRAQEGLVDVLRYGVRSPRVVAPTLTPGLDLLPVGSATVDLHGTYGSDAAGPLFEELRRERFLVVNGPGPSDADAAAPLMRRVASWVLLVEIGRSDAETSRRLRDLMGSGRCAGVLAAASQSAAAAAPPAPPLPPKEAPEPPAAATPAPASPAPASPAPASPEPPRPEPAQPLGSRLDPSAELPAPPPLPHVSVRPVKNVTPARGTRLPERRDPPRGIAADPKGGRRIGWWIGGVAVASAAIAVLLLRPESETPPTEPAPAVAPSPPRAERPVPVQRPPAGGADAGTVSEEAAPAESPLASDEAASPAEEPVAASPPPEEEPAAASPAPAEETPPPRRETAPPPAPAPRDFLARTVPLIAGETVWAVHVSSFQTQGPADEEAARFAAAGFPTVLHSVEVPEKGRWIRIYVGPFADRATAEEAAGRVRADVQEYTMIRRLPAGELQDGTGREGR